jgi:hypothetical protein
MGIGQELKEMTGRILVKNTGMESHESLKNLFLHRHVVPVDDFVVILVAQHLPDF